MMNTKDVGLSYAQYQRIESSLGVRALSLIHEAVCKQKSLHIGIMGGTFDPIHWGHLVTAECAYEQFALDMVLFMVTGDPYQKRSRLVSPAVLRCKLVEAAIADNPAFELSNLEVGRCGASYTVDTLRELSSYMQWRGFKYNERLKLSFITGADVLLDMKRWKNPQELCAYADIIAATRPGYELDQAKLNFETSYPQCTIELMEIPALAISSSFLRRRCFEGKSIRYLTEDSVIDIIRKEGMYTDSSCL